MPEIKEAIDEVYRGLDIENIPDARDTNPTKFEVKESTIKNDYEDIKIWTILALLMIIVLESTAIVVLSLTLIFR